MADRVLSCEGVSCGYEDDVVLEGVDLLVRSKEVVVLFGRSGSGKSTLLRTMAGLLEPVRGVVELFGRDLYAGDFSERMEIAREVGLLFQHDALFGSMTALDNVMLPLVEQTELPAPVVREIALSKLALLQVDELADRMPFEVSGGQRKRVALARAAVLDPKLLLCDEPTSGLDPVTAAQIDRTLLQLRSALGVAVVAVTHDVASIRAIADRAIFIGQGGIRAQGTLAELEASGDRDVHAFFHSAEMARPERSEHEAAAGRMSP